MYKRQADRAAGIIQRWQLAMVESQFDYFWSNSLEQESELKYARLVEASRGHEVNARAFAETMVDRGFKCAAEPVAAVR